MKPNSRNIHTFFPTYTTIVDQESDFDAFFNYTLGMTNKDAKRSFSVPKDEAPYDGRDAMDRRRLVPLKKHTPIEKKLYRPQPNVTFLNVEKVSLIPIPK